MIAVQNPLRSPLRPVPDTLGRAELRARGDAFAEYVGRNRVRSRGEAWRLIDTLFPGMSVDERGYVYDRGRGLSDAELDTVYFGSDG